MAKSKPEVLANSKLTGYLVLGAACLFAACVLMAVLPFSPVLHTTPLNCVAGFMVTTVATFGLLMVCIASYSPPWMLATLRGLFFASLVAFLASMVWWIVATELAR